MVNRPVIRRIQMFGFTLIELLVALSIISLLLSIAVPRYLGNVSRAEEAVLRQNLFVMRDAIQKYYSDQGRYPERLDELVQHKYLRAVPGDPVTGSSETWILVPPSNGTGNGIFDVKSGAKGKSRDGLNYGEW